MSQIVGRLAELATARKLVDGVVGGRGAALLVAGEAGIGKTRLLTEVAAIAGEAGLGVLAGRATPGGGTFRAVAQALAGGLRARPLLDSPELRPYRETLSRLAPGWVATEPWRDSGPDPAVALGEGVLALLRALHGDRGSVLVLDDLHWADADTVGLLIYLAEAVPEVPVLLVLSARDDESAPGVADLTTHPGVTVARLARLKPAEVAELVAGQRGGVALPEPRLRRLIARTEGLPLLVEELLDADVSPTLAALVARRLAALGEQERRVMAAGAVVGDPDCQLLAAVTGIDEAAIPGALRAATEVGLLAETDGRLWWRHALTRDAVLATLSPPDRVVLAVRAAQVLDERGDPQDRAAAADLFTDAGKPERAAAVLLDLARRDAARGALRSARDQLDRAAETGRLVGAVAAEQVRVHTLLGEVDTALAAGQLALDASVVVGAEHAELCLCLARAAVASGRWAMADAYLERAGRPADPQSLVVAADAANGAGDMRRSARLARAAVRAAERGDRPEQARIRCEALLALADSMIKSDLTGAAAVFRQAAQVAAEHALTPWRVTALFRLGAVEVTAGDPTAASLAEAKELAVQVGMLGQAAQADLLRAAAILLVDGPSVALPVMLQATEQFGRLRMSALQGMGEISAAWYAAMAGDLPTMTAMLDAAASREHKSPEVITLAPLVRAMPSLFAHDLPTAARLVDEAISALLPHGSAAPVGYFGLWALLRTAVGDRDQQARDTLRGHRSSCAVDNQAALGYADAIADGRAGRADQAAARFAEADAAMAREPWWNRLLRLIALEAAVADGWGDPVPALRADLTAHEHAGEQRLARTCRDLLRAAGAETRRGRGASAVPPELRALGITSREIDVLELVAAGLTNAEVATRLFLSVRTVETHVTRLLAKTGATARGELRAWAAR